MIAKLVCRVLGHAPFKLPAVRVVHKGETVGFYFPSTCTRCWHDVTAHVSLPRMRRRWFK